MKGEYRVLAVPHMVAGAAIGKVAQRPWIALPAAFVSHFVLDALPHMCFGGVHEIQHGGRITALQIGMGISEILAVGLLVWIVRRHPAREVILGSALAAVLIDILDYIRPWSTWFHSLSIGEWFKSFHCAIQYDVEPGQYLLGLGPQVAVIALGLWIILARKPHTPQKDFPASRRPRQ